MRQVFVSCGVGIEAVLERELQGLGYTFGYTATKAVHGGVLLEVHDFSDIYRLNLLCRCASRVFVPLVTAPCRDKKDLYDAALQIDWLPFFKKMPTFTIDVNGKHPAFVNSLYAAQVMKDAICDQLRQKTGERPSVDTHAPKIRLSLFLQPSRITISFDTTAKPLHERGYRQEGGVAPLRENLAAALLLMASYTGSEIACDPCAGTGTLLIEAALIATKTPPSYMRNFFGFQHHPEYSPSTWQAIRQEEMDKRIPLEPGHLIAIERTPTIFADLERAVKVAGFYGKITLIKGDFRTAQLPVLPNFVITNPPYGKRLSDIKTLGALYESLGVFLKQHTQKPARSFILSGSAELSKQIPLRVARRHIVNNGGIDCRLLEYVVS